MRSSIDPIVRASRAACALALAVAWGFGMAGLTIWQNRQPAPPTSLPQQETPVDSGYVTSDACRSCHPGNHASWQASFHRTMTQLARRENIIPNLDELELSLPGTTFRFERQGDTYFVRQRDATAAAQAFGPAREIALLTGSHHQQNFWLSTEAGRALEPLPFGWLIAEKKWAPVGDTFLGPPEVHGNRGAAGAWNNGCLHCHTTNGRPRRLSDGGFDSRVTEFGIACASCHGEGAEHIAKQRNPITRYLAHFTDTPDSTIANPARMSGPASALVCAQCHSIWAFEPAEAEAMGNRDGTRYQPGQSTLADRFVAQPATADHAEQKKKLRENNPHFFTDSFWGDGMVRVTGREYNGLELSPCFKVGAFSCLSCHEMHPAKADRASLEEWRLSQMKPTATSDQSCFQCHKNIETNVTAHTHHARESAGSRCYDCHMPHSSFGLLRAVRSHQISSPSVEETLRHGRPNACNLCHLDRPLAWTAEKLQTWYKQPAPALSRDDHEIAFGAQALLKGDAGQRALIAWSMGWAPAQQAAGRDWFAPYLAMTLNDPYAAVRYVAGKSLQTLPGFPSFVFDYTADDATTFAAAGKAYQQSLARPRGKLHAFPPATLLDASGRFEPATYQRLLDARDNRRIYLIE